jgi:branched-chain amino acid transport system substrate-binding protein
MLIPMRRFVAGAAAFAAVAFASGVRADLPPLKIGIVYSYSGAGATLGKTLDGAIDAWVAQHGDTVAGRKVVFIKRDDTGIAPDVARRLAQELVVEQHVDILMGSALTPNAIAVAGVSTQAKVPFFIVNAATSGIIAKHPYTARFGLTEAQATAPLAQWALRAGIRTAYVVYQDYGPGIDAGQTFEKVFLAGGGHIVGEARVPVSNQEYSAYIQRAKDAKPQAMYVFLNNGGGSVAFLHGCQTAGFGRAGIKILAAGALVDEDYLPIIGEAADGLITAMNYSADHDSALNREFVKTFEKVAARGVVPDFNSASAYDVMAAIYKVVQAQNGVLDPDKTMELVKGMKFESPRGPIMIDAQTRDVVQNIYIRRTIKRRGAYVNVEFETAPMVRDPNES